MSQRKISAVNVNTTKTNIVHHYAFIHRRAESYHECAQYQMETPLRCKRVMAILDAFGGGVTENAALRAQNATYRATLENIEAQCDEAMGEWSPVGLTYLPMGMYEFYGIRQSVRDVIAATEPRP